MKQFLQFLVREPASSRIAVGPAFAGIEGVEIEVKIELAELLPQQLKARFEFIQGNIGFQPNNAGLGESCGFSGIVKTSAESSGNRSSTIA